MFKDAGDSLWVALLSFLDIVLFTGRRVPMAQQNTPSVKTAADRRRTSNRKGGARDVWDGCPLVPVEPPTALTRSKAKDWLRIAGTNAVMC